MAIQPKDEDKDKPDFPAGMGARAGSFMGALKGVGINLGSKPGKQKRLPDVKEKTYMKAAQMRLRRK